MRYLIVDDREESLYARSRWLLESADDPADLAITSCDQATFEQARALGNQWEDYDCLVVDAHDDNTSADREARADEAGVPYRPYDRFPGREVVLAARRHHPGLLIITTSYFAVRDSSVGWQFAEAGTDYIFPSEKVNRRETFVAVVRNPARHQEVTAQVRSASRRTAEISELLDSATKEEVNALIGRKGYGPRPRSRRINTISGRLRDLLDVPDQGGAKKPYRQHMTMRLRAFLGIDHPTMDGPKNQI